MYTSILSVNMKTYIICSLLEYYVNCAWSNHSCIIYKYVYTYMYIYECLHVGFILVINKMPILTTEDVFFSVGI